MPYAIIRHYFSPVGKQSLIRTGLTLAQAQAHCNDPETSSSTATSAEARAHTAEHGPWFDGYEEQHFTAFGNPAPRRLGLFTKAAIIWTETRK